MQRYFILLDRLKRLNKQKIAYHLNRKLYTILSTTKYYDLTPINSLNQHKELYGNEFVSVWNEETYITDVFELPPINLYSLKGCLILPNSDFVIQEDTTIWEKIESRYHSDNIIFVDFNLVEYHFNRILIRVPIKKKKVRLGVSLCGVHSDVWSHFLVQYLPKLNIAAKLNIELTLITPNYKDGNIIEILNSYLLKYKKLSLIKLKPTETAKVDELLYINNIGFTAEHSYKRIYPSFLIPSFVSMCIKESIDVEHEGEYFDEEGCNKLFLRRTGIRNLSNYLEIENHLQLRGYRIIEPSIYSIEEKKKLFGSASIIVSPFGSALTNLIFCNSKVQVLVFSPESRKNDGYFYNFLREHFTKNMRIIYGVDTINDYIHSDYFIPLEKVIKATNAIENN